MNSKLSKAIVMFVATMLLVNVFPVFAPPSWVPTQANAIFFDPPSVNLSTANPEHTIGYKFRVYVWIKWTTLAAGASEIMAWQIKLYYNKDILNATDGDYTGELFAGLSVFPAPFVFTPEEGWVGCGETITLGHGRAPPVTASLCWIEFEVMDAPGKGELPLTDIFNIAHEDTIVMDDKDNKYLGSDYGINGEYSFEWEAPPAAYMSVEHDGSAVWPLVYGPWPPSAIGQTFNAEIYVNVAEAWGLTGASFRLCFNDTVIDTSDADITIVSGWTGTATLTKTPPPEELATIDFNVAPVGSVGGKVLVATVRFTVILQQESPPYPFGHYDESPLDFCNVEMRDHITYITVGSSVNGKVIVRALRTVPYPWLEVSPAEITMGPEYSMGKEFDVDIIVRDLHTSYAMIGWQVRVGYDPVLIEVVDVTEGPFLQDSRWNLYGTFFTGAVVSEDGEFGPHVGAGGILLPNPDTGEWDMPLFPQAPGDIVPDLDPPVNPVLCTIRFKVKVQPLTGELSCGINILPAWLPEDCHFIDVEGDYIPTDTAKCVNGTYTIKGYPWEVIMLPVGRMIDVYGGAVNRGYGSIPFPAPYGGQGPNAPMDLVIPQSVVYLFANVTYNLWPVQSKDVGFEIEGPFDQETGEPKNSYFVVKYSNRTDSDGTAWIKFQMPWPCENPEDLFGKYKVTVTVDICGVVVMDTLEFDYYYLLEITKITTDKDAYQHCNYVEVTVEFKSKAQQNYTVLFSVVIQDELETHFGSALIETEVGGAQFCTFKIYVEEASIHIPKWAFAGVAKIFVSAYDKDPTEGGAPWCPPATTEIIILPL
jgi:hypothetical protein